MLLLLFLLSACSTNNITVIARTQGASVEFEVNELSLRKTGQTWYDDWTPLAHLDYLELHSDWQEIGWMESSAEEYHHIFLDADRVMMKEEEIKDIVEPTYLGRPISQGNIKLELGILEAPDGTGLFLFSAE